MAIGNIFPFRQRLSNIVPFSYRDGATFASILYGIKDQVTQMEPIVNSLVDRNNADTVYLTSPDGERWIMSVSNTGAVSAKKIAE